MSQTKTYTGKLISHEFKKEGVTNGRTWQKYLLIFADGFKATAFDAIRAESIGREITIEVENRPWKGDDGVMRDSWTIVSARPQRRGSATPAQGNRFNEVMGVLTEIQAQIVELRDELASLDVPRK